MTIKPIETSYAGCRFRSRLEARWAVFFDTLGVRWEYEAEGFDLPSGHYLPDFLLRGLGGDARFSDGSIWFEVKPDIFEGVEDRSDDRWAELARATGIPLIAAFGMPRPDADLVWGGPSHNGWMELFDAPQGWDNARAFTYCDRCDRLGITFEGRSGRVCHHPGNDDGKYTATDPRLVDAYRAARSARFEHGGSG